ncbi:alpha/beta hydrolase family protein, partial [Oscillibacter sp.]|uniref:alpha/beta hydrolase family protein n=1 Tax=Oscillibacter sp. TaxID=1945593 RepID=UPI002A2F0B26|nr:hypothetical protein [Oscillibacter sp.]
MKKIWTLLLGAALIALTGCASQTPPAPEGNLLNFDLGQDVLTDFSGREIPYEVQGVLGIPEGKNRPVVVIVHGSHPIEKASEARYDTGFNYLTQALSEQGNLVLSMNVAMNYSFEDGEPYGNERTRQILARQLSLLKKAVDGDKKVFNRDLSGVGDFSKVVLLGHSRGGLDVLECAENLPEGMRTVGVVSVAPSTYKAWETPLPNVPVGIVIPQMDGDVISLDGSDIYEQLLVDERYTSTAELIYLKGANHGYFNTQLTQPVNVNEYLSQVLANIRATFANEYLSHLTNLCYSTLEPLCVSN